MTRDEAIRTLLHYKCYADGIATDGMSDAEAFYMAIEALSRPSDGDLISRKTAIEMTLNDPVGKVLAESNNLIGFLESLPAARTDYEDAYERGYTAGQMAERNRKEDRCDTCIHNEKVWFEEPCNSCCENYDGYERREP